MAAIVTGSDSGIGRATAVVLARRGHDVGITYSRDEDGADETAQEVRSYGRRAEVRHLDLADGAEVPRAIEELAEALGGLDVLVNNAGSGTDTPFLELDPAVFADVVAVDLTGTFLASQAAARHMALELAEHGITVNAVAPGEIATPMTAQEDVDPHAQKRPGIPLGRPGDAREVAELIAWVASPEASYTTGASYVVDGGMLLMAAHANQIALGQASAGST